MKIEQTGKFCRESGGEEVGEGRDRVRDITQMAFCSTFTFIFRKMQCDP